jgi:imidazole glycerol-phosphate synthase subunit HisF
MLCKRIIPCLDISEGRTVKGTNFVNLRDAGDPVELAVRYCEEGADELVFLDITATNEKRRTLAELVKKVAKQINIPFTVGGGIRSVTDVNLLLESGADKIAINTSAVENPQLIDQLANEFGSQCIVLAMDVNYTDSNWKVFTHGGKRSTTLGAIDWAKEAANRGAGEILLTSMNNDGTRGGFANDITSDISTSVSIPVIASGGAGNMEHFREVFTVGNADAALAASIFHYREIAIPALKQYLSDQQIPVRI